MANFNDMKEEIERYYSFSNYENKDEYVLVFNKDEFKLLLKALKKFYIQLLYGRNYTKKGYDIQYIKLKLIDD